MSKLTIIQCMDRSFELLQQLQLLVERVYRWEVFEHFRSV